MPGLTQILQAIDAGDAKAAGELLPLVYQELRTLAAHRLIELYTATNKPDEVKKWQAERAKYPTPKDAAPMPSEKK